MVNNIQKICVEHVYWPCTHAYRQLTFMVTLLKKPMLFCKVNYMWNYNERGWNSNIIDELIRIIIINLYITHSILYWIASFLWIYHKQKLNLRRPNAQGLSAHASLRSYRTTDANPWQVVTWVTWVTLKVMPFIKYLVYKYFLKYLLSDVSRKHLNDTSPINYTSVSIPKIS